MLLTIDQTSVLYNLSNNLRINTYLVHQPIFRDFSFSLKKLERRIGFELVNNTYWNSFFTILKRYMYDLILTPLPYNSPSLMTNTALLSLINQMSICEKIYPSYAKEAWNVLEKAITLNTLQENPLLDVILDKIELGNQNKSNSALLVKNTHLIPSVEKELAAFELLDYLIVISPNQLRSEVTFATIFYTGPLSWLPEFVLTASRASNFNSFKYDWVYDSWKYRRVFLPSYNGAEEFDVVADIPLNKKMVSDELDVNHIDSNELDIKTDWKTVVINYSKRSKVSHEDEETVEACIVIVEGDMAVLLENNPSENLLIIDFTSPSSRSDAKNLNTIKRVSLANIEPDMFILLRTGGGGDYIITLADRILGSQAINLREKQERWKNRLREEVRAKGLFTVSKDLIRHGSTHANEINIRNWMSPRSIRPFHQSDFLAIIKYIGFEREAIEHLKNAQLIYSAHRRAGFQIRNLLLQQILLADISKLIQLGRMDFTIPYEQGGSFTAIRIKEISNEHVMVPFSQLGYFIRNEHDLWHV